MSYIRYQTVDEAFELMQKLKKRAVDRGSINLREFLNSEWTQEDKLFMMEFVLITNKVLFDSDIADGRFE